MLVDDHLSLFMVLVCYFSVASGWTCLQHRSSGMLCVDHTKKSQAHHVVKCDSKSQSVETKTLHNLLLDREIELGESSSKRVTCKSPIDWSVGRNLHVLIVFLLAVAYSVTVSSYFSFCGALVQQNGGNKEEISYLLSIGGISDIIGNITLGILFDISFVRKRITLFFCFVNGIFAAVILVLPFLKTFSTLCAAFVFWGLLSASSGTKNVVLSENVTKDQLADAVGISLMGMAIGYGGGPFFTGNELTYYILSFIRCIVQN